MRQPVLRQPVSAAVSLSLSWPSCNASASQAVHRFHDVEDAKGLRSTGCKGDGPHAGPETVPPRDGPHGTKYWSVNDLMKYSVDAGT